MKFEHYRRSGTKMLRCGYTTGTCAALAAAAATRILLTGKAPASVGLMTGRDIPVEVPVEHWGLEESQARPEGKDAVKPAGPGSVTSRGTESAGMVSRAWAAIPKDAGDDADVTDGILIRADVSRLKEVPRLAGAPVGGDHAKSGSAAEAFGTGDQIPPGAAELTRQRGRVEAETETKERTSGGLKAGDVAGGSLIDGIFIDGGRGVGRVTKPGLDQPVGNAAINSGPRRMIRKAVLQACEDLGYDPRGEGVLQVIISVPEGEEAAKKTFNPKLGIQGGISILGTTGIVEPMSEQALVDTIEVELKQIVVNSGDLIITPGNYGSDYIAGQDLDALGVPVLKFSNFLGETLDMIAGTEIRNVLLVAHVGKLSKVAAGIMNTHSKYADGRNEIFCAHAAVCGATTRLCRQLMEAATTDACIELLDGAPAGGSDTGAEHDGPDPAGSDTEPDRTDPDHAESDRNEARTITEREGLREDQDRTDPNAGSDPDGVQTGLTTDFRRQVIGSILQAVQDKLEHRAAGKFRIGALMFSNVYGLLGMTGPAEEILTAWEEQKS